MAVSTRVSWWLHANAKASHIEIIRNNGLAVSDAEATIKRMEILKGCDAPVVNPTTTRVIFNKRIFFLLEFRHPKSPFLIIFAFADDRWRTLHSVTGCLYESFAPVCTIRFTNNHPSIYHEPLIDISTLSIENWAFKDYCWFV